MRCGAVSCRSHCRQQQSNQTHHTSSAREHLARTWLVLCRRDPSLFKTEWLSMRFSVFGFWLVSVALAFAQLAPQTPQAAYEGQNVSAVSLIANPHRNLETLLSVVTQKAGSPYSEDKIEQSADALKKAGGFPEVRVNVVPDVSGLRINFLLEPAFYLGVVDFPGV